MVKAWHVVMRLASCPEWNSEAEGEPVQVEFPQYLPEGAGFIVREVTLMYSFARLQCEAAEKGITVTPGDVVRLYVFDADDKRPTQIPKVINFVACGCGCQGLKPETNRVAMLRPSLN
ncbi:hypothetical protein DTL21_16245 [Bremerella cremea]|uniref:Uncharacterized protein n=1 Tax=Blastopirellula marina TaxID=124 RepID=A0A2S8FS64_9BACT|nr:MULTISPECIES: hypothetical protein [Pirellulaceae]PQO35022.1 hypothetical protein C5Y83_16230 [Blastopirellula marina]RCS47523.1 hypothetical protein DTL21_16245 [Bremerella cremea]